MPDRPGGSEARSIAVSTSTQLAAKLLHVVLNIVSTLAVIRAMTPSRYGDFVLVLSVTTLMGVVADFGLAKLAVREIAGSGAPEGTVIGTAIVGRLFLSAVAFVLAEGVLFALGATGAVKTAAAVASVLFITESVMTVVVVCQVRLRQHYEAIVRVCVEAVETTTVVVLVARHASLVQLFTAPSAAAVLGAIAAVVVTRRRFGLHLSVDWAWFRRLLRQSVPVGPALLLGVATLRLESVLLAAMRSARDVGIYGAAFQPIEYAFLTSAVVIGVLFPLLARWHGVDRDRFQGVYRAGTETLVGAVLPLPVVLAFVAGPVVSLVYSGQYVGADGTLRILAVALVLMTVNAWNSFVLLAGGRQRVTLAYDAAALVLNLLINVALVTWFGVVGAAWAVLATNAFVAVVSTAATRGLGVTLDWGRMARLLAAGAVLAATLAALQGAGVAWWAAAGFALATYPVCLQVLGLYDVRELRAAIRDGAVGGPDGGPPPLVADGVDIVPAMTAGGAW